MGKQVKQPSQNTSTGKSILCDLGRTRMLFALASDDLEISSDELFNCSTDTFVGERPLACAVKVFLDHRKLKAADHPVSFSLPVSVIGDGATVSDIGEGNKVREWEITKSEISELGFRGVLFANDMVSASLAIPIFVEGKHVDPISGGMPAPGYPIGLIGVRTGLGAMALVQSWGTAAKWIPVQAEGGYVGLSPNDEAEHELMHIVRKEIENDVGRQSLTITAQDILAGRGVPRLYRAVCRMKQREPKEVSSARDLAQLANWGRTERPRGTANWTPMEDIEVANLTIEYWCRFFGSFARNIAMVYGARGGIYLIGRLPQDFLSLKRGNMRYRDAFRKNFHGEGPIGYLERVPVMLVTHPNPYLKGISRTDASLIG